MKRTKCARRELHRGRSHAALIWSQPVCQAAPVITYPSLKDQKKKVLTLNIQNKVHVFSDSSSGSHNEAGVYIWIRKHTQNNFLMFGMTVCVCLSRGLVK